MRSYHCLWVHRPGQECHPMCPVCCTPQVSELLASAQLARLHGGPALLHLQSDAVGAGTGASEPATVDTASVDTAVALRSQLSAAQSRLAQAEAQLQQQQQYVDGCGRTVPAVGPPAAVVRLAELLGGCFKVGLSVHVRKSLSVWLPCLW